MPARSPAAQAQIAKSPENPYVAKKSPTLTFFAFFSIYFIWGSTYLAIRYAVATIPPLYTAGLRHLAAGAILFMWALAKGLANRKTDSRKFCHWHLFLSNRSRYITLGRNAHSIRFRVSNHRI